MSILSYYEVLLEADQNITEQISNRNLKKSQMNTRVGK